MNWWKPENFEQKMANLHIRAELIKTVRRHFDGCGFMEVETPILQVCPTVDTHIHGFKTDLMGVDLKVKSELYLHSSPEFEMKKLLVAGMPKIYQICKAFRNGEGSKLHRPEFTIIEWYRADTDYNAMMDDCEELLQSCAQSLSITHYRHKDAICDPFRAWQKLSVAQAFSTYAGIDLDECLDDIELFQVAIQEPCLQLGVGLVGALMRGAGAGQQQ